MTTHSDPRSFYGSPFKTKWVPLGWKKKTKQSHLSVCVCAVVKPHRIGRGGGDYLGRCRWKWEWSHLFAPYYLGGRRETHRQGEHHWKAWKRELPKRQHCPEHFWDYTAVSKALLLRSRLVAQISIKCGTKGYHLCSRAASASPRNGSLVKLSHKKLCPSCLLQEWSF